MNTIHKVATTSEVDGGKEKYTAVYNSPALTTVTDALGRETKYFIKQIGQCFCTHISHAHTYTGRLRSGIYKASQRFRKIISLGIAVFRRS